MSRSLPYLDRTLALGALAATAVLALDGAMHVLAAQTPFGGPRPRRRAAGGVIGWLLAKQSEFYREMSSTIRAAKSDGSAVWALLAISFAYGIFHAAGPGHGKAVISSYLVANRETARRGIALAFVSAMLQSLVAVLIVAIGAWLLNITAKTMCGAEKVIAIASYGLIAAFGARLVWTKGATSSGRCRHPPAPALALASASVSHSHVGHDHHHDHSHAHHEHSHDDQGHDHVHAHAHDHDGHVHDEHCGHSHGPLPSELAGPGGWRAASVRFSRWACGLLGGHSGSGVRAGAGPVLGRHCRDLRDGDRHRDHGRSYCGAAVSAGGIARRLSGASEGSGALIMRGIEFAAAGLVLLFGVGLLTGYLFAEPLTCLQSVYSAGSFATPAGRRSRY